MDESDLIIALLGGLSGGLLTVAADIVSKVWAHFRRPILLIEADADSIIGREKVGAQYRKKVDLLDFGFRLTNSGKTVARQLQAFVVAIQIADDQGVWSTIITGHFPVPQRFANRSNTNPVDLIPGGTLIFHVAYLLDKPASPIFPTAAGYFDHIEKYCDTIRHFKYHVLVLDETGNHYAKAILDVKAVE